jgi:tRNA-splicing ligase RtcB
LRTVKARQFEKLGIPHTLTKLAKWLASDARRRGVSLDDLHTRLGAIVADPAKYLDDPHFAELARGLATGRTIERNRSEGFTPRAEPAPYRQWGDDLEAQAVQQMHHACSLPVAVAGALMPDAHVGYGLPIGGVLATRESVIPYAVGVDIACRMKMTVLDLPVKALESQRDRLVRAIETETRFGMGVEFGSPGDRVKRRQHEVLDEDWNVSPITRQNKDKAAAQLGTSGSGNHFVEFGTFTVGDDQARQLHLPQAGVYLALLSHSGSRGTGAQVCDYYSKLAMQQHPELPRELMHLAWLDMASHEGREYWAAMQLMGKYAAANHVCIHRHIAKHLGADVLLDIENHHNFAWQEEHVIDGQRQTVIVHRKGATPAQQGVLGIIPGSMASPGFVVRGKGVPQSLQSASHGAGRVMSRTKAKQAYRWPQVRDHLEKHGVTLLSAGLDEVPFVYKNIDTVMAAQQDLVEVLGRFDPKLVKMAPAGEKAED